MKLLSILIAMAITAILAAAVVPNIAQMASESQTAKAARTVYSAWDSLASSAVASDGALLVQQGQQLVLTSGTGSAAHVVTWNLPSNTVISLNGLSFSCLWLNGDGIPATSATCSAPIGPTVIPDFTVSVNGGANVPANP